MDMGRENILMAEFSEIQKEKIEKRIKQALDMMLLIKQWETKVEIEFMPAHVRPQDLGNKSAVYGFYYVDSKANYHCLKIGLAHNGSSNRFVNQHYLKGGNGSTLAKSIFNETSKWNKTAKQKYDFNSDVGAWIRQYTARFNVFFEEYDQLIGAPELLECYLHYHLKPRYEKKWPLIGSPPWMK